jgi:hypothetical protein
MSDEIPDIIKTLIKSVGSNQQPAAAVQCYAFLGFPNPKAFHRAFCGFALQLFNNGSRIEQCTVHLCGTQHRDACSVLSSA